MLVGSDPKADESKVFHHVHTNFIVALGGGTGLPCSRTARMPRCTVFTFHCILDNTHGNRGDT